MQIEYALAAVASGAPSVGIKGLPVLYLFVWQARSKLELFREGEASESKTRVVMFVVREL